MSVGRKICKILRDYCEKTSLVGLGYISNSRIHFTERLFWLICIIASAGGSYYLIREYQNEFESNAISLVIEGTQPQDKTQLPAIGVCQIGVATHDYPQLVDYVQRLDADKYNADIDDFLSRIVFPNMYSQGSLAKYCEEYLQCSSCPKCPAAGYKELAMLVRANCSDMIYDCRWNGKAFNCCDYFLPLQSPDGLCFAMNSMQTTTRNSSKWLNTEIGWNEGYGELQLKLSKAVKVHVLNPEDIPLFLTKENVHNLDIRGQDSNLQLTVESIINDPGVRAISPEYRKCRFPDENFENSAYDYYSFTTCVSDCLRELQLKSCGCVTFNYLTKRNSKTPACDYNGFICLEKKDILRPRSSIIQPWRSNGLMCKCLPSCTSHEIKVFENSQSSVDSGRSYIEIKIRQSVATQQFRRQAVRTSLDVVVTIGGILGLFMGASVLSGIEILYFFLIRIFNLGN